MTGERSGKDILLTENIRLGDDSTNKNVFLIGGTEDKKTAAYIGPNILNTDRPFVITDRDGVLYRQYRGLLKRKGYDIKRLDFTGMHDNGGHIITDPSAELIGKSLRCLGSMDEDCRYNPFDYIRGDEDAEMLAAIIAGNIFPDRIARKAGKLLISALIAYLYHYTTKENWSFDGVILLLKAGIPDTDDKDCRTALDFIIDEVEGYEHHAFTCVNYRAYKEKSGTLSQRDIVLSCLAGLQVFGREDAAVITTADDPGYDPAADSRTTVFIPVPPKNRYSSAATILYARPFAFRHRSMPANEVGLETIESSRTALFVILPSEDRAYDLIATMMYAQLFKSLGRNLQPEGGSPHPLRILAVPDEFTNIARIPDIEKILLQLGKSGVSVTLAVPASRAGRYAERPGWEEIAEAFDTAVYLSDAGILDGAGWFGRCLQDIPPVMTVDLDNPYHEKCTVVRRCKDAGAYICIDDMLRI